MPNIFLVWKKSSTNDSDLINFYNYWKMWYAVVLKNHMSSSIKVYAMNCWYLSYSKSVNLIFETSLKKSSNMEYKDLAHITISSSYINKF